MVLAAVLVTVEIAESGLEKVPLHLSNRVQQRDGYEDSSPRGKLAWEPEFLSHHQQ
ncbi:GM26769 [Drosophila sechellia]|uniref:GM26769 n=1 Tax=Drosophila sechellia TaxID=7238 RepID=B4IIZ0_DROSE|nr:GM26769 [Drosophila sechellia]